MDLSQKYSGLSVTEIFTSITEHDLDSWNFSYLLKAALTDNNINLITALSQYNKVNKDTLYLVDSYLSSLLSFDEIKKHLNKLALFYQIEPGAVTANKLYKDLVLKHITKQFDQKDKLVIDQKEVSLKQQYLKKALEKSSEYSNTLTIFHDSGHAFLRLECTECNDGKPAVLAAGFYPPQNDGEEDDEKEIGALGIFGSSLTKSLLTSTGWHSYGFGSTYSVKLPTSSFGYFLLRNTVTPKHENYDSEDSYSIIIEHTSFVANNRYYIETTSDYENFDNLESKSFNISAEAATSVLENTLYLCNHCSKDYSYKLFKYTCLDFIQQTYNLAGLPGDHFVDMHPQYPYSTLGAYKAYVDNYENWIEAAAEVLYESFCISNSFLALG